MPIHQFLDTWVTVGDVRLTEYEVQRETLGNGTAQVTCWIPSEAGKEFSIHVRDSRLENRTATISRMWADGTALPGSIISPGSGPDSSTRQYESLSDVLTHEGRKRLAFKDVKLTDDDMLLSTVSITQLGELKIVTSPIELLGQHAPDHKETMISMGNGVMHERSKKAGVHNVQLGSTSTGPAPKLWRAKMIGEPIVEFIFRYRPLDLLRANGIVPLPTPKSNQAFPRASTSSPVRSDSNPRDPMQATQNEIRELEERLAVLKRKRDTKEEPGIKSEPGVPTNRRRTCNTTKDEVIDLTLDDD